MPAEPASPNSALPTGPGQDDYVGRLAYQNVQNQGLTSALSARVSLPSADFIFEAVQRYHRLLRDENGSRLDGTRGLSDFSFTARLFISLVQQHPDYGNGFQGICLDIFGDSSDPMIQHMRGQASEILAMGALASPYLRGSIDDYLDIILQIGFGLDDASKLIREILTQHRNPGDPVNPADTDVTPIDQYSLTPEIRKWIKGAEKLRKAGCINYFMQGLGKIKAGSLMAHVELSADHITKISPDRVCAGDTIIISGEGFGNKQPDDVEVWIPTRYMDDGFETSGPPVVLENSGQVISWSDTEIQISRTS